MRPLKSSNEAVKTRNPCLLSCDPRIVWTTNQNLKIITVSEKFFRLIFQHETYSFHVFNQKGSFSKKQESKLKFLKITFPKITVFRLPFMGIAGNFGSKVWVIVPLTFRSITCDRNWPNHSASFICRSDWESDCFSNAVTSKVIVSLSINGFKK